MSTIDVLGCMVKDASKQISSRDRLSPYQSLLCQRTEFIERSVCRLLCQFCRAKYPWTVFELFLHRLSLLCAQYFRLNWLESGRYETNKAWLAQLSLWTIITFNSTIWLSFSLLYDHSSSVGSGSCVVVWTPFTQRVVQTSN